MAAQQCDGISGEEVKNEIDELTAWIEELRICVGINQYGGIPSIVFCCQLVWNPLLGIYQVCLGNSFNVMDMVF